jgi:hypothetical protein
MTDIFQIKCIKKRERQNPHERIQNVGGIDNGRAWKITEETAIQGMESGKWKFYVSAGTRSVWVVVATHNGRKYLKTEPDAYSPDNLLSLPECP